MLQFDFRIYGKTKGEHMLIAGIMRGSPGLGQSLCPKRIPQFPAEEIINPENFIFLHPGLFIKAVFSQIQNAYIRLMKNDRIDRRNGQQSGRTNRL